MLSPSFPSPPLPPPFHHEIIAKKISNLIPPIPPALLSIHHHPPRLTPHPFAAVTEARTSENVGSNPREGINFRRDTRTDQSGQPSRDTIGRVSATLSLQDPAANKRTKDDERSSEREREREERRSGDGLRGRGPFSRSDVNPVSPDTSPDPVNALSFTHHGGPFLRSTLSIRFSGIVPRKNIRSNVWDAYLRIRRRGKLGFFGKNFENDHFENGRVVIGIFAFAEGFSGKFFLPRKYFLNLKMVRNFRNRRVFMRL